MDANQLVAIENAVMRIVCGDSRSYYVGRPVEEMNPLIKIEKKSPRKGTKTLFRLLHTDEFLSY